MDELDKMQAETVTLRGNELLPLDDPRSWWVVESGSVGVYGVVSDAATLRGRRRFLLSVGPGQALFGLPRAAEAGKPRLVAVALGESRLLRPGGEPGASGAERIEGWMRGWRERLGEVVTPNAGDAAEELRLFQGALLDRVHDLWRADDRKELELFREGV